MPFKIEKFLFIPNKALFHNNLKRINPKFYLPCQANDPYQILVHFLAVLVPYRRLEGHTMESNGC